MWFIKDIVAPGVFQRSLVFHDIAFARSFLMLLVHIYLGIIHPKMTESLNSTLDGKISVTYAKHDYCKLYEETPNKEE